MNLEDGCSKSFRKDGIQLRERTARQVEGRIFIFGKQRKLFILVVPSFILLMDFVRLFSKLWGKDKVKKNVISQLDKLQFRNLTKGRKDEKWLEVIE